jgi:uncharacterized protein (DUF488 family)
VYTIGHSCRRLGTFLTILSRYGVKVLVDVRRYPRSRYCPWFSRSTLERELQRHGIAYLWLGDLLGGLGIDYTRHTSTAAYRTGVAIVASLALSRINVAVMCRERWWMRCHRAYIADTLYTMGFRVAHIIDLGRVERHRAVGLAPKWASRYLDLQTWA